MSSISSIKVAPIHADRDRDYDIVIGSDLFAAPQHITEQAAEHRWAEFIAHRPLLIITDDHIAPLHLAHVQQALHKHAQKTEHLIIKAGEGSKSFATFEHLMEEILALGIDRETMLVALGGGVVGDLVGFVAATLLRGLDFIQIPTSLLAQVDSAVGGKTGINTKSGKNLVGAFHQPRLVLADVSLLKTLPPREMRAGYAEIVKYGALGDEAFFFWLEENSHAILKGEAPFLHEAVRLSCQAKAQIVREDEKEHGKRAWLNLGHTFAHAFEAEAGYDGTLLHGEAVAVGMVLAFAYSCHKGYCAGQDAARLKAHLHQAGLPTSLNTLPAGRASAERLVTLMQKDKKTRGGKLTLILATAIGQAFIDNQIETQDLTAFLERCA